ncbi:MAG: hypothetical protein LBT44_09190, partial [Clostridiales bacterium]|nr:hypothetical protein [Clostridiales bacterium]
IVGTIVGTIVPAETDLAAGQSVVVDEQLDLFDFSALNQESQMDFKDLVQKAIHGELDLSPARLAGQARDLFLRTLLDNGSLMRGLFLVAVLSAILQVLTDSFKNKSVGELGFYVSYMALVTVLFASFQIAVQVMTNLINHLSAFMAAALPVMLGILAASGHLTSASAFNPLFVFVIEALTLFIRNILTPALTLAAVLEIVNFLSTKDVLTNLAKFIQKLADWSLKGIAILFLGVLSLQKVSSPILNHLAVKAAKAGANAIPVVGGMVSGALDTVLVWSAALKSGVMVALVIALVAVCCVPLMEILAMLLIYKIVAAVVQPVSDERIVKCLDAIGAYCGLLLGAGVTVVVMFIVSVVILLAM